MTEKTDIAALREAALMATAGEWCTDSQHSVIADAGLNANYYVAACSGPVSQINASFISLANPATIIALLDQLEAERQQREVLEVGRRNVEAELKTSLSAVNSLSVEFAGLHSRFEAAEAELAALRGPQEPVAWTDAEELRDVEKHGCGYLFKIDPANPYTDPRRQIMVYRRQPKPVVVLPTEFFTATQNASGMFELSEACMCGIATGLEAAGIVVRECE